jgi:hypothetical protein
MTCRTRSHTKTCTCPPLTFYHSQTRRHQKCYQVWRDSPKLTHTDVKIIHYSDWYTVLPVYWTLPALLIHHWRDYVPNKQLSLVICTYKSLHSRWPLRDVGRCGFHWHNIHTDFSWTTEQWRWSVGALLSLSLSLSLPIDRPQSSAREANYRNIAPGHERAPKLKWRALFPVPYPTRSCNLRQRIRELHISRAEEGRYSNSEL